MRLTKTPARRSGFLGTDRFDSILVQSGKPVNRILAAMQPL